MYIYIYALEVQADYFLNGFSVKTIVLVGIYNQQFKGTILFMVFDFQGVYIYMHIHTIGLVPSCFCSFFCTQETRFHQVEKCFEIATKRPKKSEMKSPQIPREKNHDVSLSRPGP